MPALRSIPVLTGGLATAVAAGQAPEFAQQYRQRLGGAIAEMRAVVERFHALNEQAYRLASWPEFARPLALVRGYDRQVFEGAWRDFEPAVPVTAHSFVWTGAGFLAGALLVGGFARAVRFRPRRAKPTT